ncbi:CDP-diacylglycerol--serine O-phosphatidyltransferase [Natrinema hispanicum]|uniref:CDP-diacylglycerol--serine O-phosphatidyltransferase n=1 Tax=Natrinema hispanicum TaxID=392421 RepID=A0A482Y8H7_9EURY|nr:CDP-alcohol phosphatidyltransferase family protein [Natrinema hispanicum]RZV11513.1 CDP-diacylglycerol--serine O-phosphatidyltransferase [Natrinema hispanicum]
MTSELREAIRGVRDRFEFADRRVVNTTDRTNVFRQLTGADYISLGALFVGWASALLFVRGEPNWALLAMFGAFCLDKADGWYARRTGTSSPFGRQVDSFIDIFAYLVPAILLYHFVLAPSVFASLIVGFLVLAFGGLRLVRHNSDGFGDDDGASYYHGTTVVHTNLVVVANYFVATFVSVWNGWLAGLLICAACPLMVSDYKAYKTDVSHALAGLAAVVAAGLALALEFGYL